MRKKAREDIIISDTNDIPGKKIIKTIGKVKNKCNAKKIDMMKLAKFKTFINIRTLILAMCISLHYHSIN